MTAAGDPRPREGVVIRAGAGWCQVAETAAGAGDGAAGHVWRCSVRGRLKKGPKAEQTVAVVGDRVRFLAGGGRDAPGVIEEVLPRRNRISRQAARRAGGRVEQVLMANLDQVVAVQSLREPAPQTGFVDRLLLAAERFDVAGVLVLNKCDLVAPADLATERAVWDYYAGLGYAVLWVSAETGQGVDALRDALAGRTSLLLGASGVGKSRLLNAVAPGLEVRIGDVTEKTGLGRHTTTRTELFPLPAGGFIADSPGLRGFDPWGVDPLEVRNYFPDFAEPGLECRFRTCLHRDEPECGVKEAVRRGVVPARRHEAYLGLLRDLEERRQAAGYREPGAPRGRDSSA